MTTSQSPASLLAAVTLPARTRLARAAPTLVVVALAVVCVLRLRPDVLSLVEGAGRLGWIAGLMWPPDPRGNLPEFARGMLETLGMAFVGVALATVAAFPLSVLAARTVSPAGFVRHLCRRLFDVLRGVDVLIWAMVFVSASGLGPFAGVMAMAVSETGVLGKLFADALDDVDRGVREGVRAAGGSRIDVLRFAVLPQAFPVLANQVLYYFESNVRSATILGLVGAGGIGFQLADRIRVNEWQQVGCLILLILAMVTAIDRLSAWASAHWIGTAKTAGKAADRNWNEAAEPGVPRIESE